MTFLDEAQVEYALVGMFRGLGYDYAFGPDIACDGPHPERSSYADVVLDARLRQGLTRINPDVPAGAIDDAMNKVSRAETPSLVANNRAFHKMVIEGVPVEYQAADGRTIHDHARLIDFDEPDNNDWLVVNQVTVIENLSACLSAAQAGGHAQAGKNQRRFDVVVFINGLALGLIELKNPADQTATVKKAFDQIQTYKAEIPSLLGFNEILAVSDGIEARHGTLTADWDRFMPWRTIDGSDVAPSTIPELDVLVQGLFDKRRLLDYLRYFIAFDDDGKTVRKKAAAYHQFHAVCKAVECTIAASAPGGDRRIGVIWHTQGSGKSLSMAFYAGQIILHPAMENPTLVVITDRNDLDDQLFGTFAGCKDLIRQTPVQIDSRADLRDRLAVASGGVIFTTIQKFLPEEKGDEYPLLSDRRNIVVIADEAHRSQYGMYGKQRESGEIAYGFAKHMRDALPNASFIGFTGTPIETTDKNTRTVFGDYIDVYDILQAKNDHVTVPIYYESRLAKLELDPEERPKIDPEFEEVTEGEETAGKEKLKSKWSRLEAMVGSDKRIGLVAEDLVEHFENRDGAFVGGRGLIVCMSRRICVQLYEALVKLRPAWHSADDEAGAIKIVMTGSASDPVHWQGHIRSKKKRERLATRFKDPDDPLKLVIVRDMWLTGFDCPSMHVMYVDKPMQGHTLMQAIARVNRVFRDKPGGLIVDYLGLADQLKKALANYTESGGKGDVQIDQAEAVAEMLRRYEVVCDLFYGFEYMAIVTGPPMRRLAGMAPAMEHVLAQEDGKKRYVTAVAALTRAFALAMPHAEALRIRDEVAFFQAIRAVLVKAAPPRAPGRTQEQIEAAIRQIVSKAIVTDQVVDIFSAAGLKRPDISILSDEFLQEVRELPHRNVAFELLQRLLNDEIKTRAGRNVVQARTFGERLEEAIRKYQARSITTAQIITELIELAKDMREAQSRGEQLGLSDEELAFYDALEVNDSAVKVLGDATLRVIARELVEAVRKNTTMDWTVREAARAKIRVIVKRILRRHGYPPDKQEKAALTVLEQAETLCRDWSGLAA